MGDREFMECQECGAPAEVRTFGYHNGVDFDGQDAVFELLIIECAAGHRYNEIGGVVK